MNLRPHDPVDKQGIADAYLSGKSVTEAAETAGCSVPYTRRVLRQAGIALRSAKNYTCNHRYFREIDTPEKAYWLGFLSADGHVEDCGRVILPAAEPDRGHLEKLRNAVGWTGPVCGPYMLRSKNGICTLGNYTIALTYRLSVNSKIMAADLATHGVVPRKTLVLEPWKSDQFELQSAYFAGLVDGDGSVGLGTAAGGKRCVWITLNGTHNIVRAFADFIIAHTQTSHRRVEKKIQKSKRNCWRVGFGGLHLVQQIIPLLWGNAGIWLDRKKAVQDDIMALEPQRPSWAHLTPCDLENRWARLGTWHLVAKELAMPYQSLIQFRYRLGMPRKKTQTPNRL